MSLRPLSLYLCQGYDVSLNPGSEEEEEEDGQYGTPPPADEHSSGKGASSEGYWARASSSSSDAEEDDAEESDAEESDAEENDAEEDDAGEHSSSTNESDGQHALPGGLQAKPSPKSAPASTPRKGTGMLKGTGPKLLPGTSRRPRNPATYNVLALSRQAIGYSDFPSKQARSRDFPPQVSAPGLRRRSEPATYNVRELIKQTRGLPKSTRKLADSVAKRPAKGNANVGGQSRAHSKKRPVNDDSGDSNDDHIRSKRRRTNLDTGNLDGLASAGSDVTDTAIGKDDSVSKSVTRRSWGDVAVSPTLQGSSTFRQYIRPWIQDGDASDPTGIIDDERIRELLALPQQRKIKWTYSSRNDWNASGKIDIVALLLQLTGDEAPSPCTKCTSNPEYGQWVGCVVMPSKLASEAGRIYGCANCVYHGTQAYCSLKNWNKKRATRQVAPAPPPREERRGEDAHKSSAKHLDQSEVAAAATTTARGKATQNGTTGHPVYQNDRDIAMRAKMSQRKDASLVPVDRTVQTLTMEPWEKAPGRIRSRNSETMENFAFSKSYLANGHEIPICKEAAFRVEVIRSGHVHRFNARKDVTRICSIAAGKLTVNMDGENPFTIGSHGMFRILPGSGCFVESEIYDDVTVHVTSIKVED